MKVLDARELAYKAHEGQVDKAGKPYIEHVARVVINLEQELYNQGFQWENGDFDERQDYFVVAWLHDVIEDHGDKYDNQEFWRSLTVEQRDAVDLITKAPAENYFDYIRSLKSNDIAKIVKLADLEDNLSENRLIKLPVDTHEYLHEKYSKAKEILRG